MFACRRPPRLSSAAPYNVIVCLRQHFLLTSTSGLRPHFWWTSITRPVADSRDSSSGSCREISIFRASE